MKQVCIYHGNCFDGMAAAWVVSRMYPQAQFIPATYGDGLATTIMQDCFENAVMDTRYILVDFSFPRNLMELMESKSGGILVIDHHKTAEADCKGLPFCIFDMNESGASLAWKILFPNSPLPCLIRYIKDRDLWQFKEPNSAEVNSFIQSYPMRIEIYENLYRYLETPGNLDIAVVAGGAIERYKQSLVERIADTAAFDKNGIPTVNTNVLFSEVPHELCKRFPNAPYAQYYTENLAKNLRIWGARSIGDFDVSEVAKQHGGGGHKNAAGWQQSLSEL